MLKQNHLFYPVVLTVSISTFVTLLNVHSINVALATIASEFGISEAKVSLIPQVYLISLSSLMLLAGKLVGRYNSKRMFVFGLGLFTVTSLFCGLTSRFEWLLIWRAIQGAGAAVVQAVGMFILIRTIPAQQRGRAFGLNGMFASLGLLLGAPLGGLLTSTMGWQWAFLLCVPVCAVCLILLVWVPQISIEPSPDKRHSLDIKGTLLSAATLSLLMVGFNRGVDTGWGNPLVIGLIGVGILFGRWLIHHLVTSDAPILDLRFFLNRPFAVSLVATLIANLVLTGNTFVLPFYLHQHYRLEADHVGALFLFFSIAYLIFSPLSGYLTDRLTSRLTLQIGALVCVVAYSVFLLLMHSGHIYPVCLFLFLLGAGLSLFIVSGNVYSFEYISPQEVGEATALYRLVALLGAAGGVNLFSAFLTSFDTPHDDVLTNFRWVYSLSMILVGVALFLVRYYGLTLKNKK